MSDGDPKQNRFTSSTYVKTALSIPVLALSLASTSVYSQDSLLEEIVVTAEKRETALQDTPVSIGAFNPEVMANTGITNIQELQNIAPSLVSAGNRGSGDGNLNLAIRGIGQRSSRINGERGVGLYIDNVFFAATEGSNLQFIDLERVEVLRGPQGTLFGRNNTGGAVRYFTNRADHDGTYGSVEATFGEYDRREGVGIVNYAASDKLALRGVFAYSEQDGHIDYVDVNGNETSRDPQGTKDAMMFRGSLSYLPTDNLSVDLGVKYSDSENSGNAAVVIQTGNSPSGFTGQVSRALLAETGTALAKNDPRLVSSSGYTVTELCLVDADTKILARSAAPRPNPFDGCDTPRETETLGFNMGITWDLGDNVLGNNIALESITGYNDVETREIYDWSTYGTYMRQEATNIEFWSQELQLTGLSFDDRLNWVVGGNYFHHEGDYSVDVWQMQTKGGGGPPPNVRNDHQELMTSETDAWGIYLQGTYAITDKLNLTLGGRYSEDEKSISTLRTTYLDGYTVRNNATWDDTNFRASMDYAWTDDIMTYFSVSDAFKSGGFPQRADRTACDKTVAGDPTLCDDDADLLLNGGITAQKPEEVINYEIGIRSELWGKLRLNLTAFWMEYTDLQRGSRVTDDTDPDCTGGLDDGVCPAVFISGNVGEVEINGIESEVLLQISEAFNITFNGAFIETEVTDNTGSVSALNIGDPLEQAPEWNYSLGANYNIDLASGAALDFNVNLAHKDGYVPPFGSTTLMTQSFDTLSARGTYTSADGNWTLAVGGTNLTDEKFEYGITNWGKTFFNDLQTEQRGAPRMIYGNVKYNFGAKN